MLEGKPPLLPHARLEVRESSASIWRGLPKGRGATGRSRGGEKADKGWRVVCFLPPDAYSIFQAVEDNETERKRVRVRETQSERPSNKVCVKSEDP